MKKLLNIMVVDDNADAIKIIRDTLNDLYPNHVQVVAANNGKEALNILRKAKCLDLIICDEVMPLMSGTNFIKNARQEGYSCNFILLSGLELRDLKKSLDIVEGVEIMTKPWDLTRVQSVIEQILNYPAAAS